MNTTEEPFPPKIQTKSSFVKMLRLMGYNKYFGLALLAVVIWGFQPYVLTNDVLALTRYGQSLFVVIRYLLALLVFFVVLCTSILFIERKPTPFSRRLRDALSQFRGKNLWARALGMGGSMYFSRLFEIYSYGSATGSHKYATFGMIFSIFFVILWDWKGWVAFYLWRRATRLGFLGFFARRPPSMSEGLPWLIQSVLVVCAALLFVFAQTGSLPTDGLALRSVGWALASSFLLSIYYDVAITPTEEGKPQTRWSALALRHTLSTALLLCFAVVHWFATAKMPLTDAYFAIGTMLSFSTSTSLKYFVGYIFLITCSGYFLENLGLSLYDDHQSFDWKILGREWASIIATMDPFVGVLVTWLLLSASPQSHPVYYAVSAVVVVCVTLQAFLRLWNAKQERMRGKSLGEISLAFAVPESEKPELLHWATRLSLLRFEQQEPMNCSERKLDSRASLALIRVLCRSDKYPNIGSRQLQLWRIAHGNQLFDYEDSESRQLWQQYVHFICGGTDTVMIRWEEIERMLAEDRVVFSDKNEKLQLPVMRSDDAVFISTHSGIPEFPKRTERTKIVVIVSKLRHAAASDEKRKIWETLLPVEQYNQLLARDPTIPGYEGLGYRLSSRDILMVDDLSSVPAIEQCGLVLVDAALVSAQCEAGKSFPAWLAGGAASTLPVVLWSYEHASVLIGELLAGTGQVSDTGLPLVSKITEKDAHKLGGLEFENAVLVARHRHATKLDVIVLCDEELTRTKIRCALYPALIGLQARIIVPDGPNEAREELNKVRDEFPLVFFKATLPHWAKGHELPKALEWFGAELARTDPRMIQLAIQPGTPEPWPAHRKVKIDYNDMARAVAVHIGMREPEKLTFRHLNNSTIREKFMSVLRGINKDLDSNALQAHCYSLYAACGAKDGVKSSTR